jgi:hypothetical protein
MVTLLQVALLEPARAADGKPDECGLASVYSTVSEETASGDDTRPQDFTAASRAGDDSDPKRDNVVGGLIQPGVTLSNFVIRAGGMRQGAG